MDASEYYNNSQMGPQERFRVRKLVVENFNVQIERAFLRPLRGAVFDRRVIKNARL